MLTWSWRTRLIWLDGGRELAGRSVTNVDLPTLGERAVWSVCILWEDFSKLQVERRRREPNKAAAFAQSTSLATTSRSSGNS